MRSRNRQRTEPSKRRPRVPHKLRSAGPRGGAANRNDTPDARDRLQKVLAAAGVASRRECEQLILEGRVEVDHQVVAALGTRVDPTRQEIRVDGELVHKPRLVYFAVHKPVGVLSTSRDPAGRPRVTDMLPPNAPRAFCVGRLDISSEGLILVTNDGELANRLTHPRHGVEKVYQVQVAGQVERDVLAQLHRGIHLAEGFAHAKHVRIKSRRKKSTLLEMVLDEGRNREIRRLLARLGHKVQRLRRIAVGPVRLGDLPKGAVRPLARKEIAALERVGVGLTKTSSSARGRSPRGHGGNKKDVDDRRQHRGRRAGRKVSR
jgi:23S rRNA pseudouridine2605 synthase